MELYGKAQGKQAIRKGLSKISRLHLPVTPNFCSYSRSVPAFTGCRRQIFSKIRRPSPHKCYSIRHTAPSMCRPKPSFAPPPFRHARIPPASATLAGSRGTQGSLFRLARSAGAEQLTLNLRGCHCTQAHQGALLCKCKDLAIRIGASNCTGTH